jgi:NADPH:quinone reductase-like Zn-dependent oxidoreductase
MHQVMYTTIDPDVSKTVSVIDVDEPTCPEGGVIIEVRARPINPADLLLLEGRHVFTPTLPAPIGIEGSGVVVAAGARSRLPVGTRVAIPSGGTWRERMAFDDHALLPLPADIDLEQAAMLCVNPFTAMGLLEGVPAGATVILNAATSAISRILLAVCRRRQIAALAVVRDLRTAESLRALGAAAVLVDGDGLDERARQAAHSPIVRALDAVAGSASGRLYDCLAEGGDLVVYGLLSSERVELPAARLVFRDVTVRGYSRLRSFAAMAPERRRAITDELLSLLSDGDLRTEVEARYPLTQVRAALAHQTRPDRKGKILLLS